MTEAYDSQSEFVWVNLLDDIILGTFLLIIRPPAQTVRY
jgi:hypothetical protein